jgi:hypothetical protein
MRTRSTWVLAVLTACAAPTAEKPPPSASSQPARPSGETAAAYEVRDLSGRTAQVHVWSRGVYRRAPDELTYLGLGLEVRNTGAQVLDLDPTLLSVEVYAVNGAEAAGRLVGMSPDGPGTRTLEPAAARDFDVTFVLPQGMTPEDVNGFRARWGLVTPDQLRSVQFTQFTPDVARAAPDGHGYAFMPAYGWYDPSFHDPSAPRASVDTHVPVQRVVVVPGHFQ